MERIKIEKDVFEEEELWTFPVLVKEEVIVKKTSMSKKGAKNNVECSDIVQNVGGCTSSTTNAQEDENANRNTSYNANEEAEYMDVNALTSNTDKRDEENSDGNNSDKNGKKLRNRYISKIPAFKKRGPYTDRFICPNKCGQLFSNISARKEHIEMYHSGERVYLCKVCGKVFNSRPTLWKHRQRCTCYRDTL